ncbi:MAG: HAD family hydrolase [Massilia sp.]|nr:HAD family hydrolase [Aquabacterium sp.]
MEKQATEDKASIVNELKASGLRVAMAGDGINDAPGVAAADVGIAIDIDICRRTYAKIRQNLFWAFACNLVGIPLAAMGLLNPVIAGAAMTFSSVSVVTNALMLRRWKASSKLTAVWPTSAARCWPGQRGRTGPAKA